MLRLFAFFFLFSLVELAIVTMTCQYVITIHVKVQGIAKGYCSNGQGGSVWIRLSSCSCHSIDLVKKRGRLVVIFVCFSSDAVSQGFFFFWLVCAVFFPTLAGSGVGLNHHLIKLTLLPPL